MSHVNSHIIIRGNYAEGVEPEPGHVGVEIHYTPSTGLTQDQVTANFKKLRKLADKMYHVEELPEE